MSNLPAHLLNKPKNQSRKDYIKELSNYALTSILEDKMINPNVKPKYNWTCVTGVAIKIKGRKYLYAESTGDVYTWKDLELIGKLVNGQIVPNTQN
jgi:hypothetical protein